MISFLHLVVVAIEVDDHHEDDEQLVQQRAIRDVEDELNHVTQNKWKQPRERTGVRHQRSHDSSSDFDDMAEWKE